MMGTCDFTKIVVYGCKTIEGGAAGAQPSWVLDRVLPLEAAMVPKMMVGRVPRSRVGMVTRSKADKVMWSAPSTNELAEDSVDVPRGNLDADEQHKEDPRLD